MPKVDLLAYTGREQAYVKHCLLEEYLPEWGYKIGSQWDTLVYVDGFAGPWEVTSEDYSDSSFAVAVDALQHSYLGHRDKWGRNINFRCILVDEDKKAHGHLERYAKRKRIPGFEIYPLCGKFTERIPAINKLVEKNAANYFKFVFLDPKGWSDIPMQEISPFLKDRSCEVLINLMTKHINRFSDEGDRADSYHRLFGRDDVLEELRDVPRENDERVEQAVKEYCRSLKQLCRFQYVSSAVILEPEEESVRYFLVFATNHPRGVEVFKGAEMKAARVQDAVRHETRVRRTKQPELSFGGEAPKTRIAQALRGRYYQKAWEKVVRELLRSSSNQISYSDLFCEAMSFPLVTPADLESWLGQLSKFVDIHLSGSKSRRKPSPSENDYVIVRDQLGLAARLPAGSFRICHIFAMSTVAEITAAIEKLPAAEQQRLCKLPKLCEV